MTDEEKKSIESCLQDKESINHVSSDCCQSKPGSMADFVANNLHHGMITSFKQLLEKQNIQIETEIRNPLSDDDELLSVSNYKKYVQEKVFDVYMKIASNIEEALDQGLTRYDTHDMECQRDAVYKVISELGWETDLVRYRNSKK